MFTQKQDKDLIPSVSVKQCKELLNRCPDVMAGMFSSRLSVGVEGIMDVLVDYGSSNIQKAAFFYFVVSFLIEHPKAHSALLISGPLDALGEPSKSKYGLDHKAKMLSEALCLSIVQMEALEGKKRLIVDKLPHISKAVNPAEYLADVFTSIIEDGDIPIQGKALILLFITAGIVKTHYGGIIEGGSSTKEE